MSAIGEFIIFLIYSFLIIFNISFLIMIWYKRTFKRILLFCISCSLLFLFWFNQHRNYIQSQADQVGIYYLTDFPDCKDCYIELKENMTYELVNDNIIVKKGSWHYESGGDYFITYIGEHEQLGSGQYAYKNYKLKNTEQKE